MSFDYPSQPSPGSEDRHEGGVYLIAGPPAASPPLLIAVAIVALSIAGPFVFVADGTPSLLLGVTALAVAIAGMLTMLAAIRAQLRRRSDPGFRRRVSIDRAGITLHPTVSEMDDLHFIWDDIEHAQLMRAAFIVHANPSAQRPGKYAVRFGKLNTPRADITTALDAQAGNFQEPV